MYSPCCCYYAPGDLERNEEDGRAMEEEAEKEKEDEGEEKEEQEYLGIYKPRKTRYQEACWSINSECICWAAAAVDRPRVVGQHRTHLFLRQHASRQ